MRNSPLKGLISPLKDGDHSMKRDEKGNIIGYHADSKHFMRHNREAMAKEKWVRDFVKTGTPGDKPKLAKTLGETKNKDR